MTITRAERDALRRLGRLPSVQTGPFAPGGCVPELLDALDAAEVRISVLELVAKRLDAVTALHVPHKVGGQLWCQECTAKPWPCLTVRAARGGP